MDINLNYALFEDEYLTSLFLQQTISGLRPSYKLVGSSDSVKDMQRVINTTRPDFIISGGHLSDGISTNELARIDRDCSIVLFSEDSELLSKTDNLKIVYSALKPITRENVQTAIRKMEQIFQSRKSKSVYKSANSPAVFTNSPGEKANSQE